MIRTRISLLLLLGFVGILRAADTAYLFTYFTKNGEDGLHLAWSEDGYNWQPLREGRSLLAPLIGTTEKLMRDPCIARGPDGTYHMVWTYGWWARGIGYASTKDFITWSEQKEIPVMAHEPTARNSWAPEIVYDEAQGEFVIFWATTIPEDFTETAGSSEDQLNHRMYYTTTKDFVTFTPIALFYDPGFSCIDATFLQADGQRWIVIKNETRFPTAAKNFRIASAASLRGPFGTLSAPFSPPGLWVEGPTAVKIGDEYLIYYDAYATGSYGALRSRDLAATWEQVPPAELHFPFAGTPERMRHGTVLEVPRALINLIEPPPTTPPTMNAGPISIPNHSFELAAIPDNTAAQGAANWTNVGVADGFGRFWGGGDFGQAAQPTDGNQIAFFNVGKADVRQALVATYASLTDYEFKIDISGRESYPATAQITLYLYADGNPANVVKSLTLDGPTVGNDVFNTYTFTATAADVLAMSAVGETIGIRIDGTGTTAGDFDLDNVRLEAIAVPGPGSLAIAYNGGSNQLTFTWNNRSGKIYDLLSSTALDSPPSTWPVHDDGVTVTTGLAADPSGTNTLVVPKPADARRFFAVAERDAPANP
jgi:hypothetical protein